MPSHFTEKIVLYHNENECYFENQQTHKGPYTRAHYVLSDGKYVFFVFIGRLSPIPGRVRDGQRSQGGSRELTRRVQSRLRYRHDGTAAYTPHTSWPRS